MLRDYVEVDVFTDQPFRGNPLAVVVDAEGLSDLEMAQFANWTNFSETTFLLPPTDPGADYRVRIFTPSQELPFAGHPTLGSAHAWLAAGGAARPDGTVVQECGVGLVTVRQAGDGRLAFAAPPLVRSGPLDGDLFDDVVGVLGVSSDDVVDAAWIDNGPGWIGVLLASAEAVLAVSPSTTDHKIGLIGPHPDDVDAAYEVRGFFPANGVVVEDPVTGSLNASAAQWLVGSGRFTPPYVATQGTALGRAGVVHVAADDDAQIWVAGQVVTRVAGTVDL
ncbi:MAG: PhzF family phenazine biosynthesis protein [Acidimicrobiales bacterium]